MDMIITDKDVIMEDILMLYYSQAVCVSICFCHSIPLLVYALITVIILRYSIAIDIRDRTVLSTVQVLSSMLFGLGPIGSHDSDPH